MRTNRTPSTKSTPSIDSTPSTNGIPPTNGTRHRTSWSRRRWAVRAVVATLVAAAGLVAAPVASASAHPYCGQVWGSLAESAGGVDYSPGTLTNVRAGRHACYDRLVLDIADGQLSSWSVQYVDRVVTDGDPDQVVDVPGGARLQVTVRTPVIATDSFFLFGRSLIDTTGYRTFRSVVFAGSYESVTTVGLGVRARLPFRAFVLTGPGDDSRLVVDVGHRWCAPGHVDC